MKHWQWNCKVRRASGSDAGYLPAQCENIGFSCKLREANAISESYDVKITNDGAEDFCGVIHIQLMARTENPKIFMPGYLYNRNTADMKMENRKSFPRLTMEAAGECESPFWMTRADRLAEPVSLLYDGGKILGISAAPFRARIGEDDSSDGFNGFSCRIGDAGMAGVGYTLGYENAPCLFVQSAKVVKQTELSPENSFVLRAGACVEFPVVVFDYAGADERAVYRAIRQVYYSYHESPREIPGMTPQRAMEMLSAAVRDYAWLPGEKMYSGFVFDKPEGFTYNKIGSLSWTNGLAVAVPMLMTANRLRDALAREQALCFLQNVMAHAYHPASGLLQDAVSDGCWSAKGWWYSGMRKGGHSAYVNGQAVYYILKAYLSEARERGIRHDDWLRFAEPVLAQMNRQVDAEFEYPFAFSEEDGHGLEYDSMGGAWCLAAGALYAQITGSSLALLRKSEQHYYDKFVRRVECYGGPLDTDKAVDDEGILAYIRAARILHELTGESKYLEHLGDAIEYECSFKLGYNTPIRVRPLSEIRWSSCGGSITSTANPHIHPMSSTVIDEMRYYVHRTNDPYIRDRLEDTVKWSLQTFNTYDGEYGYGKTGWMSERFCFCQGLLTERYPDGETASTWFALMPWASASILEGLVAL